LKTTFREKLAWLEEAETLTRQLRAAQPNAEIIRRQKAHKAQN
jgi:hypothetical protein